MPSMQSSPRPLQWPFAALLGFFMGLTVLASLGMAPRWQILALAGLAASSLAACFSGHLEGLAYSLFLFALPLQVGKSFFYEPYAGGGHELRINLPDALFVVVVALSALRGLLARKQVVADRWPTLAAVLFLILSALSLSQATNVPLGLFELIRAVAVFAMFAFVLNYVQDAETLRRALVLLLVGTALQVGAGLYQWLSNTELGLPLIGEMPLDADVWSDEPITRVGGLIGHPNAFGTYLVMTLPLCLVFWSRQHGKTAKVLTLTLLTTGVVALAASGSRGAWLGLTFGGVAGVLMFLRSRHPSSGNSWALVGLLSLSLSLALALSYNALRTRARIDDRGSAASRLPMMVDALNVIAHHPMLGVGMNNYALAVPRYDVTGIHRQWQPTTVHNLLLLVAAESGVPAGLAFGAFWILIMRRAYRLSAAPTNDAFLVGLAFVISLLGFLVIAQVDPNYRFYPSVQRVVWVMAGLAVSACRLDWGLTPSRRGSVPA